jgi:predicted DNA-binding protein
VDRKQGTTPNDIVASVRLPRELHKRVEEVAKQQERTWSAQVRVALQQHLEKEAA